MSIDMLYRKRAVRKLPTQIGVYVLCDLDQVPIYVGQSVDGIRSRVARHLTSARSDIIANRQIDVWEIAWVDPRVATLVVGDFFNPISLIGVRSAVSLAGMPVPKTAMNEDGLLSGSENKIRTSGQSLAMQAEAVAERMQQLSDGDLGLRVLALDRPHDLAAFFSRNDVHAAAVFLS